MDYVKIVNDSGAYTGALYKFESELMKIIVKNPSQFHIGETVTCVYSNVRFISKILKKQDNHLYILVPQTYKYFPNDKRKHPRIKVDLEGCISHPRIPNKFNVKIVDLSRMGFGVLIDKDNAILKVGDLCRILVNFTGNEISANLLVRNLERLQNEKRYGCEIHSISEDDEFELRKFILAEQLKRNMIY